MKSRMDRYYQTAPGVSRTNRNKELYSEKYYGDYDLKSYSNVEGVAEIDSSNMIDLDKLQDLLKKREMERINETPHLVNRNVKQRDFDEIDDEKDYDIKQVLSRAKTEKSDDNKTRNLNNTCYDILKNINIKEEKNENTNLQELLDTIVNTKALGNLNDRDLSLDMLGDLKSDNDTKVINPSEMKDEIKQQSNLYKTNDIGQIDNSFYTTSLGFKQEDFEELKGIQDSIKTNNKLIKVLVTILIVVLLGGLIFLVVI